VACSIVEANVLRYGCQLPSLNRQSYVHCAIMRETYGCVIQSLQVRWSSRKLSQACRGSADCCSGKPYCALLRFLACALGEKAGLVRFLLLLRELFVGVISPQQVGHPRKLERL
jgi:hypothetical protein